MDNIEVVLAYHSNKPEYLKRRVDASAEVVYGDLVGCFEHLVEWCMRAVEDCKVYFVALVGHTRQQIYH